MHVLTNRPPRLYFLDRFCSFIASHHSSLPRFAALRLWNCPSPVPWSNHDQFHSSALHGLSNIDKLGPDVSQSARQQGSIVIGKLRGSHQMPQWRRQFPNPAIYLRFMSSFRRTRSLTRLCLIKCTGIFLRALVSNPSCPANCESAMAGLGWR